MTIKHLDKTVIIEIDGKEVEVDEHCKDMVLFLNEIGMKTKMCCQGHEKPIYRIWFDVSDDVMQKFIRKTGEWTDVFMRPTNEERTELETYRGIRGLMGWIYKRCWYPMGKYREDWIYQVEAITNKEVFSYARKDLMAMKAIYFGTDLELIQKKQQEIVEQKIKLIKKRNLKD